MSGDDPNRVNVAGYGDIRITGRPRSSSLPLPTQAVNMAERPGRDLSGARYPAAGRGAVPLQIAWPKNVMGQDPEKKIAPTAKTGDKVPMGKAILTRQEAEALLAGLLEATKDVDDGIVAEEDSECIRDLASGPYPLAVKVRDRLQASLAVPPMDPMWTFLMSHGEINAVDKTLACAEELDRIKTTRVVVTTGAGIGAILLVLAFI